MQIDFPRDREERAEALRCLFTDDPFPSDRIAEALQLCEAGEIDLSGLVGARIGGRPVAAGLACKLPDGTAFAWPPSVFPDVPQRDEVAVGVIHGLVSWAAALGSRYVQAAVDPQRADHRAAFAAAGFRLIAGLRTLQRPLDRPLRRTTDRCDRTVPFEPAVEERFRLVIERTYQDSLDCPAFDGVRTAAEALNSYRFAGDFTPQRWRLVERAGDDVAVVIVNDHFDERSREIVYLGVVPEARGAGLARCLVEDVIAEAMIEDCDSVLTAVDVANDRALGLYARMGFVPLHDRQIFVWQSNTGQNAGSA